MKILAIESSCDETAVAVLDCRGGLNRPHFSARGKSSFGGKILSNIVASQAKIHASWGGVVPNLAKREHQRNFVPALKQALKESKQPEIKNFYSEPGLPSAKKLIILEKILEREPELFKKLTPFLKKHPKPDIDLIAVTNGPGLEPALWVGINFAKALAFYWEKPMIGINHLEGHIFSVFLRKNREISNLKSLPADATHQALQAGQISKIKFPVLALIVSGGHTELVLIKDWLKYKILGQTLDDAAGEAFDKAAKMLGLGYPGGPVIGAMADKKSKYDTKFATAQFIASLNKIKLPRPMLNSKDYNFSFSGLKTAVLYLLKDLEKKIPQLCDSKDAVNEICAEFQQAVIDVLIVKTVRAVKEYKAKTIILGGGVAGNRELRRQLKKAVEEINFGNRTLLMPEMEFTGDNAAMIALAAYFRALKNPAKNSAANKKIGMISKITADSNLRLK